MAKKVQIHEIEAEYKSLPRPHAIKAIDDRQVTTIFSVAGVLDSYDDIVLPGAFAKTIADRGSKIFHLWSHDFFSPPIAVVKSLREIPRDELPPSILAEYPEAAGGAEAVSEFLETDRANEVLSGLKAGAPLGASFGYDVITMSFAQQDGKEVRLLKEVRLHEISTVLWGANPAALGSKMPLDILARHLKAFAADVKAGRRNAGTDQERINEIARLSLELGADNIKLLDEAIDEAADKAGLLAREQKQEPPLIPLEVLRAKLHTELGLYI